MRLIQEGFGKKDTIDIVLSRNMADGVVLSPRNELQQNMPSLVTNLASGFGSSKKLLFDPQYYLKMIPLANPSNLASYRYFGPAITSKPIEDCIKFQIDITELSAIVCPSTFYMGEVKPSESLSMIITKNAIDDCRRLAVGKPIYATLAITEGVLRNSDLTNELLNAITLLDVDGFYIITQMEKTQYPSCCDANALSNLMYLTYSLHHRGGYEVIHGYSDLSGLLLECAGANCTCTGWSQGLRQFTSSQWQTKFARQPKPRYTSSKLMNSIFVNPEVMAIQNKTRVDVVLSGTASDSSFKAHLAGKASWNIQESYIQHLESLNQISTKLFGNSNPQGRISIMNGLIDNARALFASLKDVYKIPFDATNGPSNLGVWRSSLIKFATRLSEVE